MVTVSLVGGAIISALDDLPYVDGLFLSTSAITCTGLFTVSMADLHTGSFITISVLTLFGGTIFLLIPPLLYRRCVNAIPVSMLSRCCLVHWGGRV